jgi:hypothetical protein
MRSSGDSDDDRAADWLADLPDEIRRRVELLTGGARPLDADHLAELVEMARRELQEEQQR